MDPLLKHRKLLKLHRVAVDAGLVQDRAALLAGIDPRLVATLPTTGSPGAQALVDLTTLNRIEGPSRGHLPLRIWGLNALALLGSRQGARQVARALRSIDESKKTATCS